MFHWNFQFFKSYKEKFSILYTAQERATREKHEREERETRKKNIEVWTSQLHEVRKQEKEMLEAKARPFRQYIMAHVMPTLTAGNINKDIRF